MCLRHEKREKVEYGRKYRANHGDAIIFYHSSLWQRARAMQLAREPLCRFCLDVTGGIVPATEIDHIVPINRGGALADAENLRSLCKPCHSRRTAESGDRWQTRV